MLPRFTPLAEPIPGYKLLERIGAGGFGEVWKAEAPGGLLKAVKLVHGTLKSGVGDEALVLQELKSLNAIKGVRHPYILSLDRYDIVDGQLVIIMELADCSLWDRFHQCRQQGQTGIPRHELLRYLAEAAEALDLMNLHHHLQHSDIKPQNLFLVHRHVKVADFGLVKDLSGLTALGNHCYSPLYAAPELFEGSASPSSDQYSLAIVYQELLSGKRPFDGKNPSQLLFQHLQKPPDVASLAAADREIICRALAKKPGERFGSCLDLVRALCKATPGAARPSVAPAVAAGPTPRPGTAPTVATEATLERGTCQVCCPRCGFTGQLPNRLRGLRIKCRLCQQAFPAAVQHIVPAAAAPPTR